MKLSSLQRPFICTSIVADGIDEAIRTLKTAEYQGATAFEVHLPLLGYPTEARLDELAAATASPIYATCRRDAFYAVLGADAAGDLTERERVDHLVTAVEAGLAGIDMELDTFDPQPGPEPDDRPAIEAYASDPDAGPAEVTDAPEAIAAQEDVVDRVHAAGGEVILSAHTYTHLGPATATAIAERMGARGADFCKLVGFDATLEDGLDTLATHLHLNETDCPPYALMAMGDVSRLVRPLAPMFGSAWVFAQPDLVAGGFHDWPLVENAREVLRRIDWRTVHNPHAR